MGERAYLPAAGRDVFLWLYDPLIWLLGGGKIYRVLVDQARLERGQTVLDVGCGTGNVSLIIKRLHPEVEVTGLDPDPKALARAAAKAKRANVPVRFERGFADELPYAEATFDRVFSSMMLHHIRRDDKPKALAEFRRVLKPGGSLEFLDIAPDGEDRMPGRLREAGFADVRRVGERKLVFGTVAFHQARR